MSPVFSEVLVSRRALLKGAAAASFVAALPGCATRPSGVNPVIGFTPIGVSREDTLRVPAEYEAKVLFRWGDPVGVAGAMPEFRMDASNSAADQALQAGMHHDGMHFYPLPLGARGSEHGLLAMNHEYADVRLMHPDEQKTWSAEKVAKSQATVGVSVIEVRMEGGRWQVVRPSKYARRVHARTPCHVAGPAAGHALLRTAADHANFGNNQMLACDPATGVFRRFLTGPSGCEITGFHTTPDNRSAFVNIQHPGEGWKANPREVSNWPDYAPGGRPRSATVVIRRKDGGIIGS